MWAAHCAVLTLTLLWPHSEHPGPIQRWQGAPSANAVARDLHEKGLDLLQKGGPRSRLRAMELFRRAARAEPQEPRHLLALAWTKARAGFTDEAMGILRQLIERHPTCGWAHLDLARLLASRSLWYSNMESGPITLRQWGERFLNQARVHYEEAASLSPRDAEPWLELGELLIAWEAWEDASTALTMARSLGSEGSCSLLLATALHWCGRDQEADALFRHALESLAREAALPYLNPPAGVRPESDPLLLTAFNERSLEHYARVTFATICFSFPQRFGTSSEEPGWQTDRGQTLIRYGLPARRALLRPEVVPGEGLLAPTELWDYGTFDLLFEDSFLNGRYPLLDVPPGDRGLHFRRSRELLEARNLAHTLGQLYSDPYGFVRDSLRLDIYRLPGPEDSLLVVFVESLPHEGYAPSTRLIHLHGSGGVSSSVAGEPGTRTLLEAGGSHILCKSWWLSLPAGTYEIVAEWGWDDLVKVASHRAIVDLAALSGATVVGDIVPMCAQEELVGAGVYSEPMGQPTLDSTSCWPVPGYVPLPRGMLPAGRAIGVYVHLQSARAGVKPVRWELVTKRRRNWLSTLSLGLLGRGSGVLVGWEELAAVGKGAGCRFVELDLGRLAQGDYVLRFTVPEVGGEEKTTTLPVPVRTDGVPDHDEWGPRPPD